MISRSSATQKRYTCPHGRQCKSRCSTCLGHPVNRGKCSRCHKPYDPIGSGELFNGKPLQTCPDCRYQSNCKHGMRLKKRCVECQHEYRTCVHNRRRTRCSICLPCPHGAVQERCRECNECIHGNHTRYCSECSGCEHRELKYRCRVCNPSGHLAHAIRTQIRDALKDDKTARTVDYLGCDIAALRAHIESQFIAGMSWTNYGSEWHIDHIVPLKYPINDAGMSRPPTLSEVIERLRYTNCQPLWAADNLIKGNRYIG